MENIPPVDDQHIVMAELLEVSVIEIVDELAKKHKIGKSKFGSLVWPESTQFVSRNRWSNMRGVIPQTGKRASCSINDAYRMAAVLGLPLSHVMLQAEIRAGQKLELMNQAAGSSDKAETPKRGRRPADKKQ